MAANGDGTPYFGNDRTAPGGGGGVLRSLVTLPPLGPAVVTAVVRHRDPVRNLVASQCGPGCPVDDRAVDRWRAPFLAPGGVSALLAIGRQPLIGLTDDQERQIRVPTAVISSSEDTSFDHTQAVATAARLHTDPRRRAPGRPPPRAARRARPGRRRDPPAARRPGVPAQPAPLGRDGCAAEGAGHPGAPDPRR